MAHELVRRPVVAAAFASGELPYAKARTLTRLDGLDDIRDTKYVRYAATDTQDDLERRVRRCNYYENQDRKPDDIDDKAGIHRMRGFGGGLGRLTIDAADEDIDRFLGLIDAYLDHQFHNDKQRQPVDESSMKTLPPAASAGYDNTDPFDAPSQQEPATTYRGLALRRLDALVDLTEEVALVNVDKIDPERAAVVVTVAYEDLVNQTGSATLGSGRIVSGEVARMLCCDAGINRMVTKGVSEILDVGRKTRTWTFAQRRAIRARHGHRCAVRGCGRRITQIHHLVFWEDGGDTCVENGTPLCATHHRIVHAGGWTIDWNPHTGITRLQGPNGQTIESTTDIRNAA